MFSDLCEECRSNKEIISNLAGDIRNIIQFSDKEGSKFHLKTIDDITKHLQKKHKLVTKGQYVSLFSSIGLAVGMGAGFATDNAGIGTAIGTLVCFLIGLYLDYKAKKEDRVI